MLHLTVTWDLLFKGKGLNHATFAVTENLRLQVGTLIILHLTVTWDLVFTDRGLNHATPDCDL